MAKKREASGRSQESNGPAELDPRDSRKRINTYEDVADSDDEFHLNQDEIRLGEEPEAKRRRKWAEQEEFLQPSDEEVLGYSDDEEASEDGEPAKPLRKSREDEDEDEEDEEQEDDDRDAQLGWGTSKADLYGADEIETEEQALEEEAEALRLQKKQLESMQAADYGFDEDEWQQGGEKDDFQEDDEAATVTEVLPQLQISPDLSPAERLKLLKSRYPEFELLSKELLNLRDRHSQLVKVAPLSSLARTKLRAISAYIGALAMYFAIFTSAAAQGEKGVTAISATHLRDHPVMESLIKCRDTWAKVEQLPDEEEPASDEEEEIDEVEEDDELELRDALPEAPASRKLYRAERHAQAVQAAAEQRRAERLKRTEAGLADLDALIAPSRTGSKATKAQRNNTNDEESDFGEEAGLTAREAADKAKKKKSLRFYTSQIAQKANKRGAAGRNAGGDDDIPFRERLRDRQARLNAEAEKRGQRGADIGAELGGDSDEEDGRQARQIRADADEDDYYDLIAARTAKKKQDKSALAEAQRQAALQGGQVVQEESVGADGKRKISYAIEKNKGLTPHRKKDVRNPRVKKRKKYDEKKKKLASIKPVYKGGEGRGGYGGELTGIKKGLVKSTKL
ncbi:hypothetical protein M409DRAFT_16890 [Zasmidium cellare ATCC 36951]|uniref:Sas10 C-terminal domain-containing protein n=1 Tax=Zasmidium cellare ATCC 36951 TaxID=1080233 RepID=A0A6A6D459_ZASCE|nr:uncharacterized protein M409DRAFT_16890 [Zasmidium cellare ATCC 36951]KAF2172939.1 hypothetical protein M409DRAFT_16890 [Zasmidium cellare ATCC 36951]